MMKAVDRFGNPLVEGDIVMYSSYGQSGVTFGRFSHATAKKLMIKAAKPWGRVHWSQQVPANLTKLDANTFDNVSAELDSDLEGNS